MLRERLYGAISCLATLAVLARYTTEDTSAWSRLLDVAVATGGLWAASLFADFVAHLGVYGTRPHRREIGAMLQASGQILQAAVIPAALLAAAGFGLLETYTAMWVAMWALVAELAADRAASLFERPVLRWWEKLLTVADPGVVRRCRAGDQDARTLIAEKFYDPAMLTPAGLWRRAANRIRTRDPENDGARRALRAAIVIPIAAAVSFTVGGGSQTPLFTIFGSIALLIVVDFPGNMNARALAYGGSGRSTGWC